MTTKCTPPETFELYLQKRELKLNRFKYNYSNLVQKLISLNSNNVKLNEYVLNLFREIYNDNINVIPTIEYERDTIAKYKKDKLERSNRLRDKLSKLKKNNSGSLVIKSSLESNVDKRHELSIKYSFIVISILVLVVASIALLVFNKKKN